MVVAVGLPTVAIGDITPVAVDVEAVEVAVLEQGVVHVVGAEYSPGGAGGEATYAGVAAVVHQQAVAAVVGAGVGTEEREIVKGDVGTVVDADDVVVGERGGRGDDGDIAQRGGGEVFDVEEKGFEGGEAVAQQGDVGKEEGGVGVGATAFQAWFRYGADVGLGWTVGAVSVVETQQFFAVVAVGVAYALGYPRGAVHHLEQPASAVEAGYSAIVAIVYGGGYEAVGC